MEVGKINVQARPSTGGGANRKLRAQGKIPGICYGPGQQPIAIALVASELQKALDPVRGRNTLLQLHIEGLGDAPVEVPVLLKDVQRDVLRGDMTHADFIRVRMDQPVKATVPIMLTGKAEGVKAGGTLHQVYRTLNVMCRPDGIPTKVEIDVSLLGIGQSVHVSDLKLPEGVTAALSGGTTLCVVTAPKSEKAAEAAAEGAEPVAEAAAEPKKDDKAKAAAPAKAAAAPAKAAPAKGK